MRIVTLYGCVIGGIRDMCFGADNVTCEVMGYARTNFIFRVSLNHQTSIFIKLVICA